MGIIAKILAFIGGDVAGKAIGGAVNVAGLVALAPAAYWFLGHKDESFYKVDLTVGDLAVISILAWFVLKLIHYAKSPVG